MTELELLKLIESKLLDLEKKIDALKSPINLTPIQRSDDIAELCAALAKAQGEMKVAGKSGVNNYLKNKYADLADIVEASRPALCKNGLAVHQHVVSEYDGSTILYSILSHSSGQWMSSRTRLVPAKNDIQSLAGCITYMRRYTYATIVGCVATNEDDDGESQVQEARISYNKGTEIKDNSANSFDRISKDQLDQIEYELQNTPAGEELANDIFKALRIKSLADMPKNKFQIYFQRILELKNLRSGTPKT